VWVEINLYL